MKEAVEFTEADGAPEDHQGYSTSVKVNTDGTKMTKMVTCTYNLPKGGKKTLTKVVTKTIEF